MTGPPPAHRGLYTTSGRDSRISDVGGLSLPEDLVHPAAGDARHPGDLAGGEAGPVGFPDRPPEEERLSFELAPGPVRLLVVLLQRHSESSPGERPRRPLQIETQVSPPRWSPRFRQPASTSVPFKAMANICFQSLAPYTLLYSGKASWTEIRSAALLLVSVTAA